MVMVSRQVIQEREDSSKAGKVEGEINRSTMWEDEFVPCSQFPSFILKDKAEAPGKGHVRTQGSVMEQTTEELVRKKRDQEAGQQELVSNDELELVSQTWALLRAGQSIIVSGVLT